jgi:hypothetical protein
MLLWPNIRPTEPEHPENAKDCEFDGYPGDKRALSDQIDNKPDEFS